MEDIVFLPRIEPLSVSQITSAMFILRVFSTIIRAHVQPLIDMISI